MLFKFAMSEKFFESTDVLKHKVIYHTGYAVHKYRLAVEFKDVVSIEFLKESNYKELSIPILAIVFLILCATFFAGESSRNKKHCGN